MKPECIIFDESTSFCIMKTMPFQKWQRLTISQIIRWDSVAGELKPRNLRGRKFYWHSDPEKQKREKHLPSERFRRQQEAHQNEENIPKVHLVKKAELQQTIAFDCLDAIGLASLLEALNPDLLLGQRNGPYGLHLGRGKPLGLGSVTTGRTQDDHDGRPLCR